ncbi:hypothetical protein E2C01_086068 [Portunus trituberculatus]|uniref:Uncharacterized protein n=1 Tax=Portunus trituberculatus TaxID=210409 RepID=A0A5B7J8P2_PORTR|nr:hypothetical protein [Portunus trituberculatus]
MWGEARQCRVGDSGGSAMIGAACSANSGRLPGCAARPAHWLRSRITPVAVIGRSTAREWRALHPEARGGGPVQVFVEAPPWPGRSLALLPSTSARRPRVTARLLTRCSALLYNG